MTAVMPAEEVEEVLGGRVSARPTKFEFVNTNCDYSVTKLLPLLYVSDCGLLIVIVAG